MAVFGANLGRHIITNGGFVAQLCESDALFPSDWGGLVFTAITISVFRSKGQIKEFPAKPYRGLRGFSADPLVEVQPYMRNPSQKNGCIFTANTEIFIKTVSSGFLNAFIRLLVLVGL